MVCNPVAAYWYMYMQAPEQQSLVADRMDSHMAEIVLHWNNYNPKVKSYKTKLLLDKAL